MPETNPRPVNAPITVSFKSEYSNVIDAAASGAVLGLRLSANIAAMLIAFIGLIALINAALGCLASYFGFTLSVETILGYVFSPIAWLMGVDSNEVLPLGNLLGTQVAINEFMAYVELAHLKGQFTDRTFAIATYALCAFCNIGSIAIQVGGIGGVAPGRRADLARLGLRAMCAGALASWLTACIAGVFL